MARTEQETQTVAAALGRIGYPGDLVELANELSDEEFYAVHDQAQYL